jgi:ligand-binding sensor domain-containing protein
MAGLCRFDGTSIEQFNPGGERWIRTAKEDPRGVLWIGTRNTGLCRFDGRSFTTFSE